MKDVPASLIGTIIGIIPGEGAAVGASLPFRGQAQIERPRGIRHRHSRGHLAPETANNATVGGALAPTPNIGVPGSPAAVLLGAPIQGLTGKAVQR